MPNKAGSKMKPILFSTPMVKAMMEGRKTQTRRLVNPQPNGSDVSRIGGTKNYSIFKPGDCFQIKPKCNVGDILWVRETYSYGGLLDENEQIQNEKYYYKADSDWSETEWHHEGKEGPQSSPIWKPSIFMPFKACRLFLKVTSVGVERLQDISEEDAINEGIELIKTCVVKGQVYRDYLWDDVENFNWEPCPRISFKTLWQSINGLESWDYNPFVWVIKFEVTTKATL